MPESSPAQSEEEQLHPQSRRKEQAPEEEREAIPADQQVGNLCIIINDLLYISVFFCAQADCNWIFDPSH